MAVPVHYYCYHCGTRVRSSAVAKFGHWMQMWKDVRGSKIEINKKDGRIFRRTPSCQIHCQLHITHDTKYKPTKDPKVKESSSHKKVQNIYSSTSQQLRTISSCSYHQNSFFGFCGRQVDRTQRHALRRYQMFLNSTAGIS